jgi:CheY-like chemotaxis protein
LNKNIPVIAITAFAQAGDKAWIMNSRFDDYISKPLNPSLLLEKIDSFRKQKD